MKILTFTIFTFAIVAFLQVSKHVDSLFVGTDIHVAIPSKASAKMPIAAAVKPLAKPRISIKNLKVKPKTRQASPKISHEKKSKNLAPIKLSNKKINKLAKYKYIELKSAPTVKNTNKNKEFELDYSKMDEQKPFKIKKLKTIAWENHGVNFDSFKAQLAPAKAVAKINLPEPPAPQTKKEQIEQIKEDNVDRISTEASAIEKSSTNVKEELVFFDYSTQKAEPADKVEKEIAKKKVLTASKGSTGVNTGSVLARMEPAVRSSSSKLAKLQHLAIKANKKAASAKSSGNPEPELPELASNSNSKAIGAAIEALVEDQNPGLVVGVNTTDKKASNECLDVGPNNNEYSYEYLIEMRSIGVTNHFNKIHNFDIQFQDNLDELERDFGEGQVLLKGTLKGELNIRRAVLSARGHYPTSIDLALEEANAEVSIPSLQFEKVNELTSELNIADVGAHLLVELDKTTEDVELGLDHNYKAKIYLDKNYNIVDRAASDFYFVFFIGVDSGNTIVQFKNIKGDILSKITHLSAGVIHYEPNFYANYTREQMSFYEENVLSNCKSLLGIQPQEISSWAFNRKFKRENLNTLSVANPSYPIGSRKYYKLTHLTEPVYLGRWNHENIIVPSEEYMDQVLKQFNVSGGECLVQVNLKGKPLDIKYNGLSPKGGLNLEIAVLDKDGKFYEEPSDQTQRLFILGEAQGIINVEITYPGNSKQYLQTYCSENTYLVEQL